MKTLIIILVLIFHVGQIWARPDIDNQEFTKQQKVEIGLTGITVAGFASGLVTGGANIAGLVVGITGGVALIGYRLYHIITPININLSKPNHLKDQKCVYTHKRKLNRLNIFKNR